MRKRRAEEAWATVQSITEGWEDADQQMLAQQLLEEDDRAMAQAVEAIRMGALEPTKVRA